MPRAIEMNILGEMPADKLPLNDLFPELKMADTTTKNGKVYAITKSSATTRSPMTSPR